MDATGSDASFSRPSPPSPDVLSGKVNHSVHALEVSRRQPSTIWIPADLSGSCGSSHQRTHVVPGGSQTCHQG
jgi:hypothetical protein